MFQNTTIRIGKMFQNQKKKFEKVSDWGIVCVLNMLIYIILCSNQTSIFPMPSF